MKKIILFLLIPISTITSLAQSSQEKEITEAVEKLRVAMVDGNREVLGSLAHDKLSYGHSSGALEDKATFVESIVSGKNDFQKITQTNQTITIAGATAIVRHTFDAELLINGTSATPHIGVLQIWQKEKGKWKLLARQAFRL